MPHHKLGRIVSHNFLLHVAAPTPLDAVKVGGDLVGAVDCEIDFGCRGEITQHQLVLADQLQCLRIVTDRVKATDSNSIKQTS